MPNNYKEHIEELNKTLIEAAKNHEANKVRALLESGALVNYQDQDGNTALHIAAKNNDPEIAKILLKHNARISVRNKVFEKPAVTAAALKHWKCLEVIATRKEKRKDEGDYGYILFIVILRCEDAQKKYKLMKCLLAANAAINWPTKEGEENYISHYAALEYSAELATLLLKYGADKHAKNALQQTPMMLATERHKLKLAVWPVLQGYRQEDNIFHKLPLEIIQKIVDYVASPNPDPAIFQKVFNAIQQNLERAHVINDSKNSKGNLLSNAKQIGFFARKTAVDLGLKLFLAHYYPARKLKRSLQTHTHEDNKYNLPSINLQI